jgi:hypothetical protein
MAKKGQRRRSAPSAKQKTAKKSTPSPAIPAAVGLVTIAIVVGMILSIESRPPANTARTVNTAQALPTGSIPYPEVPRVSLDEATTKLAAGAALLVDVRSKESFDRSHAAGAVSIPEDELGARLSELPRDQEIYLYCT